MKHADFVYGITLLNNNDILVCVLLDAIKKIGNILCMAYPQNGGHLEFLGDSISKAKILIPV